MTVLTQARLKELLRYDPKTGVFTWRVTACNRVRVGEHAGHTRKSGYVYIGIEGVKYAAHRLAWLYMTGGWPRRFVDHRNCRKADNRWRNLREADMADNQANRGAPASNKSGYKGVYWNNQYKKWTAAITKYGKCHYIGRYDTAEAAHAAYCVAAKEYHGAFARFA